MTSDKVVVRVTGEPRNGANLRVEGADLIKVALSRHNWDEKASQLKHEPTRTVINNLRRFSGIDDVEVEPHADHCLITIHCDCDRQYIEDAVAAALQAELVPYEPPLRHRGLRESLNDFLTGLR